MLSPKELFVSFIIVLTLPAAISCYYNETKFKELVMYDTSNDDAVDMTTVSSIADIIYTHCLEQTPRQVVN